MEEFRIEAGDKIPKHVGLILDGNRRWAKNRHLDVNMGHLAGYENLKKRLLSFHKTGIRYLSIYALSLENVKKRTKEEIDYIYGLIGQAFESIRNDPTIKEEEVKVIVSGRISLLPENIQQKTNNLVDSTKNHNKNFVNICVMYDGQEEIVDAVKKIVKNNVNSDEINRELLKKYLYTKDFPEVDYIIRTGMKDGARISGFMLWDSSYAEFRFREEYWPDYSEEMLLEDLREYLMRKRRMGE